MNGKHRHWEVAIALVAIFLLAGCRGVDREQSAGEPYQRALISPGAKFAGLPRAVQDTVRAEVGAAEIADIKKDTSSVEVVYKFFFENSEANPPLFVAADGSVLNPDHTVAVGAPADSIGIATGGPVVGLRLSDLPPKVVKAIQENAPQAEVGTIIKETCGDRVVYVISFKDEGKNPKLCTAEDGTLVSVLPD